jgi:hypothetical protein
VLRGCGLPAAVINLVVRKYPGDELFTVSLNDLGNAQTLNNFRSNSGDVHGIAWTSC